MDVGVDRTELEGLQTEAKALNAQIDVLQGMIDLEKDETKLKIQREDLKAKTDEFAAIGAKVEVIKGRIRDKEKLIREELVTQIADLTQSKVHAHDMRDFAAAKDAGRDERAHMAAVGEYLAGKKLGDYGEKMRNMLSPKGQFSAGAKGIVLPGVAVDCIFGEQFRSHMLQKTRFMDAMKAKASCSGTGDYSTPPYASQNEFMSPLTWTEYKKRLLDLPGEPADIIARVTTVPAVSGTAQWVRTVSTDALEYASVVASWLTCEGDLKSETQIRFETFDITCFELQAYTEITDRALNRSIIPIEGILNDKFRKAVMHTLETAVLVGSGAGEPDGIVDVAGIHTLGRNHDNNVFCEDLIRMEFQLRRQHRQNAMYAMQDNAALDLKLARFGTDCECVVSCFDNSQANGYPYQTTHRLPALGTAGDVLFGDFSEYILAIEQEIVLARSSEAGEMFQRNSTAFKIYMIVGGEVAQPRAFVQLDDCDYGSLCCVD